MDAAASASHTASPAAKRPLPRVVRREVGTRGTIDWRLFFHVEGSKQECSPWHHIPVSAGADAQGTLLHHFVCEVSKGSNAKNECATSEPGNPIKQDVKGGKLRFYEHGNFEWNYGYLPQTWEDPAIVPADTGCPGDNDPLDCVEIGSTPLAVGAIAPIKVLGVLVLIDDGETDYKLIAISSADPKASLLNDVEDVEKHMPGTVHALREYFRDYKKSAGKINKYAMEAAQNRAYALKVIETTHEHWNDLHHVRQQHVISESGVQLLSRSPAPELMETNGTGSAQADNKLAPM